VECGEQIKENLSFECPSGIDLDEEKNILYVVDKNNVTLLDLELNVISSWSIPMHPESSSFRGLKVDRNIAYLTIDTIHQIFLCNSQDGKVLKKWGTSSKGSIPELFYYPHGLTINNEYVYVCDCDNHRIQILTKEGKYSHQWGTHTEGKVGFFYPQSNIPTEGKVSFFYPRSIYYSKFDNMFYIGDNYTVQIFIKIENQRIQRIGGTTHGKKMKEFSGVYGISVINDRLYVSDCDNRRIQLFRRIK